MTQRTEAIKCTWFELYEMWGSLLWSPCVAPSMVPEGKPENTALEMLNQQLMALVNSSDQSHVFWLKPAEGAELLPGDGEDRRVRLTGALLAFLAQCLDARLSQEPHPGGESPENDVLDVLLPLQSNLQAIDPKAHYLLE